MFKNISDFLCTYETIYVAANAYNSLRKIFNYYQSSVCRRGREREKAGLPLALEIATVLFIVGIVSHRVIYFQPFSDAAAVKRI